MMADFVDLVNDPIQKVPVVGYDQQCARVVLDVTFEPGKSINVQMVCRFVQDQEVALFKQKFGKR